MSLSHFICPLYTTGKLKLYKVDSPTLTIDFHYKFQDVFTKVGLLWFKTAYHITNMFSIIKLF